MPFEWSRNRDERRPKLRKASGLEWISSTAGGVRYSVKGTLIATINNYLFTSALGRKE